MSSKVIVAEEGEGWLPWQLHSLESIEPKEMPIPLSVAEAALEDEPTDPDESSPSEPSLDNEGVVVEDVDFQLDHQLAYPTAAEIEAIHQEAFQAGFDAGREAGLVAGRSEAFDAVERESKELFQEAFSHFTEVQASFIRQLDLMEQEVAPVLLSLALSCAKKMVGDHFSSDPDALLPVLQEAMSCLPSELKDARLRVNPLDAETVRRYVDAEALSQIWTIVEDEKIERGGCLLDTRETHLNLTVGHRWQSLVATLGAENYAGT